MGEILVGTSGYSYQDWVGDFYPPGTKQSEYLAYYARHFPVVELNFSFYRLPEASMTARMVKSSEGKLLFAVKAYQELTHKVEPGKWREVASSFLKGIAPLAEAEKLAAVLLQFPYSFHYTAENRLHLDELVKELEGLPLAVEIRHKSWHNQRFFDALTERNIALVHTDTPLTPHPSRLPLQKIGLGYVRFHGRNRANWWSGDSITRYDYFYSEQELREWVPLLKKMSQNVSRLLVFMNNHARGQATKNGQMLIDLLKAEAVE